MGFDSINFDELAGPIYMGANSSWEVIWFAVSVLICVIALIVGAKHELDAYEKLRK